MLSEKRKRLHKLYGFNVRFDRDSDDPVDKAITDAEKKELEDNPEFEKTRQRADQEAANAAKARERAAEAEGNLDSARSENEQLKEQLAEAEAKAAEAGIEDVELDEADYEGTDLALVKAIKGLNDKIGLKDKEIKGLKDLGKKYEQQEQGKAAQNASQVEYDELLSGLDEDYGVDCRNAAVKAFQQLRDEGKILKGSPAKATRLMEKCYKDARKAKDAAKKKDKSLNLDTGSGGGSLPQLEGKEIPDDLSLDDAVEAYGKAVGNIRPT